MAASDNSLTNVEQPRISKEKLQETKTQSFGVAVKEKQQVAITSSISKSNFKDALADLKKNLSLVNDLDEIERLKCENIASRFTKVDFFLGLTGAQITLISQFLPIAVGNLTVMFVWLSILAYICQQKFPRSQKLN